MFIFRIIFVNTKYNQGGLSGKRTLSETNLELSSVVRLLEHRDYEPIGKKYYSHLKYKFTHTETLTHYISTTRNLKFSVDALTMLPLAMNVLL